MPNLDFQVRSAEAIHYAAAPQLVFKLRIVNSVPDDPVHAAILNCQIRIEPNRREYTSTEKERLRDLFDEPSRWSHTVRSMLWTHCQVNAPPFADGVDIDLHVPCTFDFNVVATKYFTALEDGLAPVNLLFSGTVFYTTPAGALQVWQIPWEKEVFFQLPVKVWQDMMDHYYPNSAWLCLRRDVFTRLYQYKVDNGIPTWETLLSRLLDQSVGQSKTL